MRNLEIERLALAAMSLGISQTHAWIHSMVQYECERQAFGTSINRFGEIQKMIGCKTVMR